MSEPCGDCMKVRPHRCPRHDRQHVVSNVNPSPVPDPRTAEERLRAAASSFLAWCDEQRRLSGDGYCPICEFIGETHVPGCPQPIFRAALAAEPVPLDVERLRVALMDIADMSPNWMEADAVGKSERWMRDRARAALAAEPVPVPEVDAAWQAFLDDLFDEMDRDSWELAEKHRPIIEAAIRGEGATLDDGAANTAYNRGYNDGEQAVLRAAALQADRQRAEAATQSPSIDVERLADDVRYAGDTATSDYWRGFNDGIDALSVRLATPPEPKP